MSAIKTYEPTPIKDELLPRHESAQLISITGMKEYQDYSFEELKLMDYENLKIAKLYAPLVVQNQPKNNDNNETTKCPICYEDMILVKTNF